MCKFPNLCPKKETNWHLIRLRETYCKVLPWRTQITSTSFQLMVAVIFDSVMSSHFNTLPTPLLPNPHASSAEHKLGWGISTTYQNYQGEAPPSVAWSLKQILVSPVSFMLGELGKYWPPNITVVPPHFFSFEELYFLLLPLLPSIYTSCCW